MFSNFVRPAAVKAAGIRSVVQVGYYQARFLATVEGSVGRQMPLTRARATPVSHDRATLTIRVCRPFVCPGMEMVVANGALHRMDQFSTERLSAPSRTSLEKLSSPPPSSVTQSL